VSCRRCVGIPQPFMAFSRKICDPQTDPVWEIFLRPTRWGLDLDCDGRCRDAGRIDMARLSGFQNHGGCPEHVAAIWLSAAWPCAPFSSATRPVFGGAERFSTIAPTLATKTIHQWRPVLCRDRRPPRRTTRNITTAFANRVLFPILHYRRRLAESSTAISAATPGPTRISRAIARLLRPRRTSSGCTTTLSAAGKRVLRDRGHDHPQSGSLSARSLPAAGHFSPRCRAQWLFRN